MKQKECKRLIYVGPHLAFITLNSVGVIATSFEGTTAGNYDDGDWSGSGSGAGDYGDGDWSGSGSGAGNYQDVDGW